MPLNNRSYFASIVRKLATPDFIIVAKENVLKKKYYFFNLAIAVALTYWLIDSVTHYFGYGVSDFEFKHSDTNDLWMRISIFILIATLGLFAAYASRKITNKNKFISQTDNILQAKRQWETVIDSLPQLVIAIDENSRVTRVNRTAESWGAGKVNEIVGLYVADFLKCLNDKFADDGWTSDWPYIWQQFKSRDTIIRKIEKEHSGRIYLYSLKKVSDYDISKDRCYAVLIIEDITARTSLENSLKNQALELEEKVNIRTRELRHANNQLEHELQAKKAANIKLKELQNCRLALLRDTFTTQEKERKRIACELHDSIGQSLGAAKFKIEELLMDRENSTVNFEYDQLYGLVGIMKNATHEVRQIAMDLRPPMLDNLGILPTLKWFCREYNDTYTKIKVDLLLDVDESSISDKKKVVIFRIVQEAMNNIAKHANATNIVIELSQACSGMTISISDNGCGFNTNVKSVCGFRKPGGSFGLSSMRERAESTNGRFKIESTQGRGTSILVSWENIDTLSFGERIRA